MLVVVLAGIPELAEQDQQTVLVLRGLEEAVAEEVQGAQGIQGVAAGALDSLAKAAMGTALLPITMVVEGALGANKGSRLAAAQVPQAGGILAAATVQTQMQP
jgi:hypothetical protein